MLLASVGELVGSLQPPPCPFALLLFAWSSAAHLLFLPLTPGLCFSLVTTEGTLQLLGNVLSWRSQQTRQGALRWVGVL